MPDVVLKRRVSTQPAAQKVTQHGFYPRKMILKKLLLIDGITRAGKFLLANLLSSLEDVEHYQYYMMYEVIPALVKLGKMPRETGIALLQYGLDMHTYEYAIGRNLNFHSRDKSSIFNSNQLQKLLARCFSPDGPSVLERIEKENKYHPYVTHGVLAQADIFFEALPTLKMIHLLRHPVDVVHSWYRRGWGKRIGVDPLDFTPALQGPRGPVPLYAHAWAEEYGRLGEMDRVITSIDTIQRDFEKGYRALEDQLKKQILFVTYEEIVEDTHRELKRICRFLDTRRSEATQVALARERCPSLLASEKRQAKLDEIKSLSSARMFKRVEVMQQHYQNRVRGDKSL